MTWAQILTMVLGSLLSLLSGAALFVFQRGRLSSEEWKLDLESRMRAMENCQASAMTELRFREIIQEELRGLELRLINEGRLAPRRSQGK